MVALHELDPELWSELAFGSCQLGHKRRTRRLVNYARQMAERPDASTPRQTESWSDCKAVYQLFQRPEVTFESVTIGHRQRTRNLLPGTYLAISDTTELDYGYNSSRRGLGRLTSEKHRGFFLHTALVLDAEDGHVVGVGGQKLFTRSAKKKKRVHRVNGCKRASEAEIWGQVIDQVQPKNPEGVRLIHVCDRGADNFNVFAHLQEKGDSWVIRAAQLTRKVRDGDEVLKLSEVLAAANVLGSYQIHVQANGKQQARWTEVEVRAAEVTLLRPREGLTAFVMQRDIREIPTWVVEVREVRPPQKQQPLHWVLYSRESASTFEEALRHHLLRATPACGGLPQVPEDRLGGRTPSVSKPGSFGAGDRGDLCSGRPIAATPRSGPQVARDTGQGCGACGMAGDLAMHSPAPHRHSHRSRFPPGSGRLRGLPGAKMRRRARLAYALARPGNPPDRIARLSTTKKRFIRPKNARGG